MTHTVNIQGKTYRLGSSFRTLIIFEEITGRNAFAATNNVTDSTWMYYAALKAINPDFTLSKDEFIAVLDKEPDLLAAYLDYVLSLMDPGEVETAAVKKKVERRSSPRKKPMP